MNPEGPAHTEERGGRTGGDCPSPCSNACWQCWSWGEAQPPESYSTSHLCSTTALLMLRERRGYGAQQLYFTQGVCPSPGVWLENKRPPAMELPAVLSMERDGDSWQAALWTLLPFPPFFRLTAAESRTAVVAILVLPSYTLFKRLLLSCLSLPNGTMALAHFSCWVSHCACRDFLVCMPGHSSRLQKTSPCGGIAPNFNSMQKYFLPGSPYP